MNFIGHATVALWHRRDPQLVLGSMLPDFAGMAGTRLGGGHRGALAEGIALHHRTDAAFHAAAPFVALLRETLDTLTERGVARGPARAVGHIGVEMLIDGELVHEAEVARAYTDALHAGAELEGVFVDAAGAGRWELLRTRLLAHGVPYDYRDPGSVLRRLEYVLRGRPRLSIDPTAAEVILGILPELQRKVARTLPTLLDDVRAAL